MTAFDRVAPVYDALWTHSAIGQLQRAAVWRHAGPVFAPGDRVLELGCGTGEDALWLRGRGVQVTATDSSPAMLRTAWSRGVNAGLLRIEDVGLLGDTFDGVFSNFGALNCVASIAGLREPLARLVRSGGSLVFCVIGRFCLWETCWYAFKGDFSRAGRRWVGRASSSLGVQVFYPPCREIRQALAPAFTLSGTIGIGVAVPPSYVTGLTRTALEKLSRVDARVAGWKGFRAVADHRLLIFRRA